MAANAGEPRYAEHVASVVEATRALLEATHGWSFGEPDPVPGGPSSPGIASTKLGEQGTIAIFLLAGIEHAVWQLPA